jgi:hypothetical protein
MSDDGRFVAQSMEEMLVALARGVREAQEALSETLPFDAFGRPLPSYHIPYLDFEIAVQIQTQRQSQGKGLPVMRFLQLPQAQSSSSSSSSDLRSTISGRLVAVPPGEGLPIPALRLEAEALAGQRRSVRVQLSNSAGELLAGQRVELNIDTALSDQLTRVRASGATAPRAGTRLAQAVLVTDERGQAATEISLDPTEHAKAVIVLVAQAGAATARLSLMPGGAE